MARLPDAQSAFGGLGSFASGRPIATYDDTAIAKGNAAFGDAIDKGTDKLAAGVNYIAKEARDVATQDRKLELSKAASHYIAGQIDLNSEFDRDTDYTTAPQRYDERLAKLKSEADGMVTSPGAREQLGIMLADDAARGRARIAGQTFQKQGNAQVGYVMQQGENFIRSAPGMSDPQLGRSAIDNFHGMVDGLSGNGYITPQQALSMKRQFADQYIGAQANDFIRRDPQEALKQFSNPDPKSVYAHLTDDQLANLQGRAVRQLQAQDLDEQREARRQKEILKNNSDDRENEYLKDLYSAAPKTSTKDIVNDDTLSREAKERMIGVVRQSLKPEPLAQVSNRNAMDLLDRIRRPENDPQRIYDLNPLYDALIAGKISEKDFNFVSKQFMDLRTPDGDRLGERKATFVKGFAAQIDKSNPLMGKIDQSGKQQVYNFNRFVDDKVSEYRKAGKDPFDLFDPSKPDYIGKPETIMTFQKPLTQSLQDRVQRFQQPATPKPSVNLTGPGKGILSTSVENKFAPPADWLYNPARKQYKDPAGKIYDKDGKEVTQ